VPGRFVGLIKFLSLIADKTMMPPPVSCCAAGLSFPGYGYLIARRAEPKQMFGA
jgi:hypothetical protein